MKYYKNRVDRFSVIAKRLVDDHSAELFIDSRQQQNADNAYNDHLNTLGKQLEQYAKDFLESCKTQNEQLKADIWRICNKYLDLFIKRNDPYRRQLV